MLLPTAHGRTRVYSSGRQQAAGGPSLYTRTLRYMKGVHVAREDEVAARRERERRRRRVLVEQQRAQVQH